MSGSRIKTRAFAVARKTATPELEQEAINKTLSISSSASSGARERPGLTPANILTLQAQIGNQAVQRLVESRRHRPTVPATTIQRAGAAPSVEDLSLEEMLNRPVGLVANRRNSIRAGAVPRQDYNADNSQDYAEYVGAGAGAVSSGASAVTQGVMAGNTIAQGSSPVTLDGANLTPVGASLEAVSGFGAASGVIGVANATMEGIRGGQELADSSRQTGDRVVGGGGRLVSAMASGTKEASTAAFHIARLASLDSAVAVGAAAAAGGASVAMGAVDMIRGGYGALKGSQRQAALTEIASQSEDPAVKSAAQQAASTQELRKNAGKATVGKGAMLVAGGVTLLVLGSNPIGWALLSGAALVGGIAALAKYLKKRARKKQVAIRELGLTEEYAEYQKRKKAAHNISRWNRSERNAAIKAAEDSNPLHAALVARGYQANDYGKFYNDYIHDTAQILHREGVLNPASLHHQEMKAIIENMGLKVDRASATPTPEQIGKALHN